MGGVTPAPAGVILSPVPWCDACDEYRAPTALTAEGTCPTCENKVDTEDLKVPATAKAPWHFWVMVVALVAYLGWRAIEGIIWVVQAI